MSWMRFLIIITAVLFLVPFKTTLPLSNEFLGIEELMKKVDDLYASANTFEADFKQIYLGTNFGEIISSGEVCFKKPGLMKWLYKKPNKKIISSDGSSLWVYDFSDSQALLDRNFKKEKVPSSISFLWGEKRLSKIFNYKLLSVQESGKKKIYVVELFPKEVLPNVTKLHFTIDGEKYLILETSIFDFFGNENRLIFQNSRLGKNISDSFFEFKPPKGVIVVEPPKISG